jgi:hypothetical protein
MPSIRQSQGALKMAKQNYGGVYANMDFPPYEFREFPKSVPTGPYGKHEIAYSKTEEMAILAKLQKDEDEAPAVVAPYVADPVKEILISRARELQIPFNSQWSKAKLTKIVEEAEADVDNLPAEVPESKRNSQSAASPEDPDDEDEGELDVVNEDELKDKLIAQAKSLGIQDNRLWGIPRLKMSITEAQAKLK